MALHAGMLLHANNISDIKLHVNIDYGTLRVYKRFAISYVYYKLVLEYYS